MHEWRLAMPPMMMLVEMDATASGGLETPGVMDGSCMFEEVGACVDDELAGTATMLRSDAPRCTLQCKEPMRRL